MIKFLETFFLAMRPAFSRRASFNWFVILVVGFATRTDALGVSSVVRALCLGSNCYPMLLHFLHASSWNVDGLRLCWWRFLAQNASFHRICGRVLLVGDDTKQPKDARRMPGVRTMHQHSETSSKPSFFRGHDWGFLCVLTGKKKFAIPYWAKLHMTNAGESRIEVMMNQAIAFTNMIKENTLLVLDAGFGSGSVFLAAKASNNRLQVIVRAKSNYVARCLADAPAKAKQGRGRPRKYGKSIIVKELFTEMRKDFVTANVELYGKMAQVSYYAINLHWPPCNGMVRFVLAVTPIGKIVLMCSDLNMEPTDVLHAYAGRAKIETFFDVLKNIFSGLAYHFWSSYLDPVSRRPRHNAPTPTPSLKPIATEKTIAAIEKFVCLQMLVIGVVQLMATRFADEIQMKARCWLRTQKEDEPTEFVTRLALCNFVRYFLCHSGGGWIMQLIRARQDPAYAIADNERAA